MTKSTLLCEELERFLQGSIERLDLDVIEALLEQHHKQWTLEHLVKDGWSDCSQGWWVLSEQGKQVHASLTLSGMRKHIERMLEQEQKQLIREISE